MNNSDEASRRTPFNEGFFEHGADCASRLQGPCQVGISAVISLVLNEICDHFPDFHPTSHHG